MTLNGSERVRLEFTSAIELLDLVQVVSDHVGRALGFDDEALHWIGVAVRESVINAIRHGNRSDARKRVVVEFETQPGDAPAFVVSVRDQGEGFDPSVLANPLDPENLLKPSGRGIFLIRAFMDDVQLCRGAQGGTEVRMTKRLPVPQRRSALRDR